MGNSKSKLNTQIYKNNCNCDNISCDFKENKVIEPPKPYIPIDGKFQFKDKEVKLIPNYNCTLKRYNDNRDLVEMLMGTFKEINKDGNLVFNINRYTNNENPNNIIIKKEGEYILINKPEILKQFNAECYDLTIFNKGEYRNKSSMGGKRKTKKRNIKKSKKNKK